MRVRSIAASPISGDPITGCVNTDVAVDDAVACTVDACDPVTGAITHTPDNAACDDANACTTDSCDQTTGCANEAVPVDDGVSCTADACDSVTGAITHTPNDAACDDTNACTTDTCDPITGCANEAAPIDDGVVCTVDACDPVTGAITHSPDDTACDNGLYCDGPELCDATQDCLSGDPPCLTKACDEATQTCGSTIPTLSHWGVVVLTLLVLLAGTAIYGTDASTVSN